MHQQFWQLHTAVVLSVPILSDVHFKSVGCPYPFVSDAHSCTHQTPVSVSVSQNLHCNPYRISSFRSLGSSRSTVSTLLEICSGELPEIFSHHSKYTSMTLSWPLLPESTACLYFSCTTFNLRVKACLVITFGLWGKSLSVSLASSDAIWTLNLSQIKSYLLGTDSQSTFSADFFTLNSCVTLSSSSTSSFVKTNGCSLHSHPHYPIPRVCSLFLHFCSSFLFLCSSFLRFCSPFLVAILISQKWHLQRFHVYANTLPCKHYKNGSDNHLTKTLLRWNVSVSTGPYMFSLPQSGPFLQTLSQETIGSASLACSSP